MHIPLESRTVDNACVRGNLPSLVLHLTPVFRTVTISQVGGNGRVDQHVGGDRIKIVSADHPTVAPEGKIDTPVELADTFVAQGFIGIGSRKEPDGLSELYRIVVACGIGFPHIVVSADPVRSPEFQFLQPGEIAQERLTGYPPGQSARIEEPKGNPANFQGLGGILPDPGGAVQGNARRGDITVLVGIHQALKQGSPGPQPVFAADLPEIVGALLQHPVLVILMGILGQTPVKFIIITHDVNTGDGGELVVVPETLVVLKVGVVV